MFLARHYVGPMKKLQTSTPSVAVGSTFGSHIWAASLCPGWVKHTPELALARLLTLANDTPPPTPPVWNKKSQRQQIPIRVSIQFFRLHLAGATGRPFKPDKDFRPTVGTLPSLSGSDEWIKSAEMYPNSWQIKRMMKSWRERGWRPPIDSLPFMVSS